MVHHQLKDQRSLKDYFKNKLHDNEPDDDGAEPGGSGMSTRSRSKGMPTNEQNLQIAKALREARLTKK